MPAYAAAVNRREAQWRRRSRAAVLAEVAMPRETEIKLRVPALESIRRRLRQVGATPAGPVLEVNRLFDTPDRRLLASGCGLRVREARAAAGGASHVTLAFKGPRAPGTIKSREELEVSVADADALAQILNRLGFAAVILYEKRRETWTWGSCAVALDELPRLGPWVEIEGPDAAAIAMVRTQLDLAATPLVDETYVEMADRHGTPDPQGCHRLVFE